MQIASLRRTVALLLVVTLLASNCSKAVYIPKSEARAQEYREPGAYRIKLEGWNEYYARRFSVTDSTVVIEELLETDDRYKRMRHDMPIVIPIGEVESISRMETNVPVTAVMLVAGAVVIGGLLWLIATWHWGNN